MSRLPVPGSDIGTWGDILNDFLAQAHETSGALKPNTVGSAQIVSGAIDESHLDSNVQTKLNATSNPDWSTITNKPAVIAAGADQASARSAIGAGTSSLTIGTTNTTAKAGDYVPTSAEISDASATGRSLLTAADPSSAKTVLALTKSDVSLGNVNNTSDLNKPISTATQTALDAKADLVSGLVPTAQLPALAYNTAVTVADQAAMLALTSSQVQPGDLAIRTDGAGTFILTAADPSQLSNWTLLDSPTAPVTSVNSQTGTVVLGKADVGLNNVDNTSDLNKPISTATQTALDAKADLVGGFIPSSQLPSLALTTAVTVANQAAMLALTTSQVQPGDIAVRTDGAGSFILTATDPSQLANWTLLAAPTDVVTSVNSQTGAVVLAKSDVGLGNVDNTSDATKNSAVATLTNKTLDNSNTVTLKDTNFTLQDDGDTTRQAKFQLSGITTGTTRTYTLPNTSDTLATQTYANTGGVLELQHDFTDDANGTPVTADTGQSFLIAYSSAAGSAAAPVVSSGALITNDVNAGYSDGFIQATLNATTVYMEGDFSIGAIGSGTTNFGAFSLQAFATSLPSGTVSTMPDSPCFVQFSNTGFYLFKWVGGASTQLANVTYAAATGTVRQHVEVVIDKANSTVHIRAGDGNVYSYTDAFIGSTTATFTSAQIYYGTASTDKRVAVYTWASSSTALTVQSALNNRARSLLDEGRALSNRVTLTGTQALTNKDLTSGTNTFPTFNQNTTGNAATATKLAVARTIGGTSFDGSANITQPYDLSLISFGANTTRTASSYGDNPFGIKLQRACTLTSVTFRCNTADASGNLVCELRKNGTTLTGSSTTIAAASQVAGGTSTGTWACAAGDIITIYVTGVGTTPGTGLEADITGTCG